MVFLTGGANTLTAGYDIENSLRFNPGDEDDLSRTPSSAGNSKTFTISFWAKICADYGVDTSTNNFVTGRDGSGMTCGVQQISGGYIQCWNYDSGYDMQLVTSAAYRDPSAWYHIVFAVDTTQGTAANRAKLYVNGSQVTAFSTETYPDQNLDTKWNEAVPHYIGSKDGTRDYFDGYLADLYTIDGTAYAASDFGETDEDSGIWKPKAADVTFGTNGGVFLEFKQSGTDADASGMGADTSGNDNHMAVNNLAATSQATDTPTNNFATLNPLWAGAEVTLSEGNCKYAGGTTSGQGPAQACGGTFGVSNGKWYFEVTRKSNDAIVGIMSADIPRVGHDNPFGSVFNGKSHSVFTEDGNARSGNANTAYGDSLADDEILGVALDMDNGAIYYSEQGTFYDSGDPTSGASKTGAASNFTAVDTYVLGYIADGASASSSVYEFNFGNPPHSISSGNADANGYGNFEFAVPSGYFAPCTKNLATYG